MDNIILNASIKTVSEALAENMRQYIYSNRKDDSIEERLVNCLNEFLVKEPESKNKKNDRIEFFKHYDKWYADTCILSSLKQIFNHKDYKAIINMGDKAIPYILEVIKEEPGFIVEALPIITGLNPKIKSHSVKEICETWLKILS